MKLTWFGATAMRIHIGGEVLVTDAALAPDWVDGGELVAGADRAVALVTPDEGLPVGDSAQWRPAEARRLIDAGDGVADGVTITRFGTGAVIVEGGGEPPLVLLTHAEGLRFGRWANRAVIVLFGGDDAIIGAATALLDVAEPLLVALAADDQALDAAISGLREHLGGVPFAALEPGMALEV